MLIPERIVVGVDGSEGSLDALRWAVAEAERDPAELWAVWVHEMTGAARAEARAALQRAIAYAAPGAGMLPVVVQGTAGRMLPRMADGARLLVLGGVRDDHHRPGTVRQACVRNAPCPVVIVVPGAGRMPRMRDGRGAAAPVTEGIT